MKKLLVSITLLFIGQTFFAAEAPTTFYTHLTSKPLNLNKPVLEAVKCEKADEYKYVLTSANDCYGYIEYRTQFPDLVSASKDILEGNIFELRVAENHQGKGYGATLLKATLNHLESLGCQTTLLMAQPDNKNDLPRLIKFYENHGFVADVKSLRNAQKKIDLTIGNTYVLVKMVRTATAVKDKK